MAEVESLMILGYLFGGSLVLLGVAWLLEIITRDSCDKTTSGGKAAGRSRRTMFDRPNAKEILAKGLTNPSWKLILILILVSLGLYKYAPEVKCTIDDTMKDLLKQINGGKKNGVKNPKTKQSK